MRKTKKSQSQPTLTADMNKNRIAEAKNTWS
jgi:hypothetical protein